jgi:hypothetical protein
MTELRIQQITLIKEAIIELSSRPLLDQREEVILGTLLKKFDSAVEYFETAETLCGIATHVPEIPKEEK